MDDSVPIRRLWTAVLCGYLALGATLQELPGYVTDDMGRGTATAALAVGAAFAATALVRPFAGRAGDAGLARPVVMAGGALTAAGAVGHLLAPNLAVLLAARLVMGAGEAALFSGAVPWVLAGATGDRRGRLTGWFGLSMWGGLSAGPVLAVLVHRLGGADAVWWTVVALPVVSSALVATTRSRQERRPGSWHDLLPGGAGLPGLCLGLAAYGYGTLTALLVLYLSDRHIGGQQAGLAMFAVPFLISRSAGSPLVDRYGGAAVARVVLLVEAAGLAVLTAATSEPVALAGVAVTGAGLGLVYPCTTTITLGRTGALRPGAAVGTMTSFWDLGILAAGPLGGQIAANLGYRTAFAAAIAATLAALATAAVLGPRRTVSPAA
ncbi:MULTISPECIES: MFS transporter [Actinomadura]|uniref:MFS transporter n=1 Tax=Actinomadura yumaensis TaxID=111807 RepID=A0ABW2CPM1_9ACTN|nr:MFS transporter [Actinomadura sp. J1-007]MWK35200.1 MFS transporter [Actinomadura sp. J1-007]